METTIDVLLHGLSYTGKYPLVESNRDEIYDVSNFAKIPFNMMLPKRKILNNSHNKDNTMKNSIIKILNENTEEEIEDFPVNFPSNNCFPIPSTNENYPNKANNMLQKKIPIAYLNSEEFFIYDKNYEHKSINKSNRSINSNETENLNRIRHELLIRPKLPKRKSQSNGK